jgi:hypothetical protein
MELEKKWVGTKETAFALGVSSDKIKEWIKAGILKQGRHYRNLSKDKKRPTYRFNLQTIEEIFEA